MSLVVKALIGLSCVSFALGVYAALIGPILVPVHAETYARGSSNLALIAIALSLACRKGPEQA